MTARRSDGDETAAARQSQDHRRGGITYAARLHHGERSYEMRSVVLRGPEPITVEVLIKFVACGVCHSDLHTIDRAKSGPLPVPVILGHEVGGIVEAVGSDVTVIGLGGIGLNVVQGARLAGARRIMHRTASPRTTRRLGEKVRRGRRELAAPRRSRTPRNAEPRTSGSGPMGLD